MYDTMLQNAEDLLVNMEQEPSDFLLDALLPVMKGLIAEALLKHHNEDVRVTVASCLGEILRITSPEQPFNDDQMKAIFQLIVEALSKLSEPLTRCYEKALSILETIARVKACLLMLDLECEALVIQMCQHLWVFTRLNPSADEYWAVEQIMADILNESEDISPDLLIPLLASVLKENEKVAPSCWKLGEKLISDHAAKLRPVLRGALKSKGTTLDDYSPVVALLYQNESTTEHNDTSGSCKQGIADFLDSKVSVLPRKREPKPNSSMRPNEVSTIKRRTALQSHVETLRGGNTSKGTSRESGVVADGLVGRRIQVWWPLEEMFYDGRIQSYDPVTKKHKVLYDDGDKETLNLEKDRWEFIEDDLPDEVAVNPKPITSPVILRKQNENDGSFQSTMILDYKKYVKRAGAATRLQGVEEAPNLGNQNIGGDESSDDESSGDNVFEFRARSKDFQQEIPSTSTSDDSTPEASPPRAIRVGSKDLQLENPGRSTSDESTPEASPLRYITAKSKDVQLQITSINSTPEASLPRYMRATSKDVQLQSTSDDSTPEGSPPRPWGLWRSQRR
ncbi:hypothetical protein NL676_006929 [Syzygium grande]|nr:hypothetical protein NL676_006929 [Syzygium grande]